MKSYKIKYGGYYKKNHINTNIKIPLNFRPIIENNFFDIDINQKFKEKYLDFDYYYHRDGYDIDTIETVEKFMESPDAVNSAVKLISFWITKLWNKTIFSEYKNNCTNNPENYVCLNPKRMLYLIDNHPNIIRLFSDMGTGFGIGDWALGQGNINLFGRGPIFQEQNLKNTVPTTAISLTYLYAPYLAAASALYTSSKIADKLAKYFAIIADSDKLYYIKNDNDMFHYIKYTFLTKHATKQEKEYYKNNMTYIQGYLEKYITGIDTTEKSNYHASISRMQNIENNIKEIDNEIVEKENEIRNLTYHSSNTNSEVIEKKKIRDIIYDLDNAKKFLITTKDQLDKDKFLDNDLINAAHILRQACYIHKIRMLIYINYPEELNNYIEIENSTFLKEDKKNNNKMSEIYKKYQNNYPKNKWTKVLQTVRTQNYIGKNVVQKSFKNKIKDLVTPIIHLIENKIDNISDNLR
jgi:hypothetical protein